jgi:hypothetical protein
MPNHNPVCSKLNPHPLKCPVQSQTSLFLMIFSPDHKKSTFNSLWLPSKDLAQNPTVILATWRIKQDGILMFQDHPVVVICKVCGIAHGDSVLLNIF